MGKLTVAKRLIFGFGLLIVLLTGAVMVGLDRLSALNDTTTRIAEKDWRKAVLANQAADLMNANARETFLLFHTTDRAPIIKRMEANKAAITKALDELEGLLYKPEGKTLIADVKEKRKAYVATFSRVLEALDGGRSADASRMMAADVVPALDALLVATDKLILLQGKILEASATEAAESYRSARTLMLVGLVVTIVIAGLCAAWVVRSVTGPLGGEPDDVKEAVERIANGDLTRDIAVAGSSDTLLASAQRMQVSLRGMIAQLQHNVERLSGASQQMAATASQVAAATTAQSESSSSMAAAVEQVTVSINHVSEQAGETHAIAADTGARSHEGSRVISETVAEMQRVATIVGDAASSIQLMGEKSNEISSIVQVIKDVADQTNLLALNAAIEAARAGEQGRGFAVVADEVRKLAERTAKATTEISCMIDAVQQSATDSVATMEQVVDQVSGGVAKAEQASRSIEEISVGAQNAVHMVNEISNALREQSVASNDIASNVEKIAQSSEENSAATQEMAATARELERMAEETRATLSRFRVA